ncbi:hypothetical protein [Endozoicomonas sp. ISHI1]|uniref:hypothetical protein n=2 Tax=unclassified Endozoicomonas TaxID=2644528 RepID=UPI002148E7F3|nr:hypothetical protein [Endozoicomonas sp. ISHI1]
MNPYQLNGLTLQQLHALIMKSSIGFSAQDGSVQFLGKQVELHDGITVLSEQTSNTDGSKQLYERLVNLRPDLEKQLPGSKAEAIQLAASSLMEQFHDGAIEKSPTKEVQCVVFHECMRTDASKTVKKLFEKNFLNTAEKLRVMLAADEQFELPAEMVPRYLERIPLSIRFEEAKNLFQRLPDSPSPAEENSVINEKLTALNPLEDDKLVKDGLLQIRQTLESENNEFARQLLSEVDNIEKKFIPRVDVDGYLPNIFVDEDFKCCTRRLLYLYAACSGFSEKADIAELMSYIRSVLYNTNSDNIWHIAKELAYLAKQQGSIDYCRYIDAVANILKAPAPVALQFEELKQLSDINGFVLLEGKPLARYLTALRANIGKITPEYSQVLLTAVDNLESKYAATPLPEDVPVIKVKVHRLLMIIAACKSSKEIMDTSVLDHFVRAIMKHGNKKNIPYLISGLARLIQSTPKIQQILGESGIKGGDHLRLAPLQWLAFVPDVISEDDIEELCKCLQASSASRRRMKDGKVFHQWLVTLERALASNDMNKAMVMQTLKKLTQSLTCEKLGLLYMILNMGDRFNQFLDSMGLSCQKEGLPLLIAEKGADALVGKSKEVSQWLWRQRHHYLLPFYMASMEEYGNTELTDLILQFTETSASNTFIESRQSPLTNPHLKAVYRIYPQFKAGWGANFSDFSEETRSKLLSPGETLKLTEDPWDLFISGLEVRTCLTPDGAQDYSRGLMSYVMDGRNAMIVRKNAKGDILSRSVIRMVLDQDDRPALFLEKAYPDKSDLLFIDAAREIADEMELPLYHRADPKKGETGEAVKILQGRAPFDYFDAFMVTKERQEFTITNVQYDVR